MLKKIRQRFNAYLKKNESEYATYDTFTGLRTDLEENALRLPGALTKKLDAPLKGQLHILEIVNDDITPMEYVVAILYGCFQQDEFMATDIMIKIHQKGSAQIIAGSKGVLKEVADFIEADARSNKFPLRLRIHLFNKS